MASEGVRIGFELAALARRRRRDGVEIRDRRFDAVEELCLFEKMDGAGRRRIGALLQSAGPRPAFARGNEPEIGQPEIRHRPRAHADVHGELRPHQNDGGAAFQAFLGVIGAGAGHLSSRGLCRHLRTAFAKINSGAGRAENDPLPKGGALPRQGRVL